MKQICAVASTLTFFGFSGAVRTYRSLSVGLQNQSTMGISMQLSNEVYLSFFYGSNKRLSLFSPGGRVAHLARGQHTL